MKRIFFTLILLITLSVNAKTTLIYVNGANNTNVQSLNINQEKFFDAIRKNGVIDSGELIFDSFNNITQSQTTGRLEIIFQALDQKKY
jgi:hypothetical protein